MANSLSKLVENLTEKFTGLKYCDCFFYNMYCKN